MCGLTGIFHYRDQAAPVDRAALCRATRRLWHRGPDEEGFHLEPGFGVGHRRLSIVDLTETGRQPMVADNGAVLAYNGEAYNHMALRPLLEGRGVRFRGRSDTETLLQLLVHEGPQSLGHVHGIFALAFWDPTRRTLLLARDPAGVKQLYVHDNGHRVIFASEIKALFEYDGIASELDPEGLNDYLFMHTPLFERTFFRNVRQVLPGEVLSIGELGQWRRKYFQMEGTDPLATNPADAERALSETLGQVVRDQLMADVPVGAFFSGGIDSTAVAAFAKTSGLPLQLFGVHFSGGDVIDERPFQEEAARALGLPIDFCTYEPAGFADDLTRLLFAQDEPVIGPAMFPMYTVSRLASRSVKVCLGGQGGDELFGGYARYALVDPWLVARTYLRTSPESEPCRPRGGESAPSGKGGPTAQAGGNLLKQLGNRKNLTRLLAAARSGGDYRRRYFEHFTALPEAAWRELLEDPTWVDKRSLWQRFTDTLAGAPATDPLAKILHWEQQTYLPGLFHQDDRMSMACSLESRVPLSDPRLLRLAARIPSEWKLRRGATKWLLRQAVRSHIPEVVLNRRKVGFDTPVRAWMTGPHRDFVMDTLLGKRARERGYFRTEAVRQLLERPEAPWFLERTWKLLCLEVWAQVFLDGAHRQMSLGTDPLSGRGDVGIG